MQSSRSQMGQGWGSSSSVMGFAEFRFRPVRLTHPTAWGGAEAEAEAEAEAGGRKWIFRRRTSTSWRRNLRGGRAVADPT